MPAARGVKRSASKASASTASTVPKNKKKRTTAVQLEIPAAPTQCGRVLACGMGDVGQLGLGEDVMETMRFKRVKDLGDNIVAIVAGGMHTIALDKNGVVWSFGCNDEGALGRAGPEGEAGRVGLPGRARAVSAGDSHSAALLHNGDVYAWGAFRDSHGSMGLVVRGREGKACTEPVKIDIGEPAAEIASGGDHLVILSTSGGVWSLGAGEQGQLGRVPARSASRHARAGLAALLEPARVPLRAPASRVWAGAHNTLAKAQRSLFGWGLNNYMQLGVSGEKRKTALYAPTECDAFNSVSPDAAWEQIVCGQHHTLARDEAGQVYAIGRCEYGRLGLGDRPGDAETLQPVPKLEGKKCISISAGTCNSFAVSDCGVVYAWGMGSEGQLGTGSDADCSEPEPARSKDMAGLQPIAASAGGQHSLVLLEVPNAQEESSPAPLVETEEEKVEKDSKGEKEKKRPNKRQKKNTEQEEEVSSTSSAQPSHGAATSLPAKVNGDEQKETPMDTDKTDKAQDKKDDPSENTETTTDKQSETLDSKEDTPETKDTDPATEKTAPIDKEETTDVEMKEIKEPEVNGTPDKVESKSVEDSTKPPLEVATNA